MIARGHPGGRCPGPRQVVEEMVRVTKILREAGLISSKWRGTWVYYRVMPGVMTRMSAVLAPATDPA